MSDRMCYLNAPQLFDLNMACVLVHQAFDYAPYLVGSCLKTREYRDVDVRLILPDDEYKRIFIDTVHQVHNPMWALLCSSISVYLSKHSGDLPIDFQIQMQSKANEEFPLKHNPRQALGIFVNRSAEDAVKKLEEKNDALTRIVMQAHVRHAADDAFGADHVKAVLKQ